MVDALMSRVAGRRCEQMFNLRTRDSDPYHKSPDESHTYCRPELAVPVTIDRTFLDHLFNLSGAWIQALFHFLTMHLTNVALDVQLQILQLCSPKDLAVVSRVHSSLRDAAEHVLYSRIDFSAPERDIEPHRSIWELAAKKTTPLLSTLSINTRKASTVKAFYIELGAEDVNCDVLHLILVALAGVLEKMQNLVDLRILTHGQDDLSQGTISRVIGGGYFKLETLYLDFCWHDLEGVIAGQPQLRFLGLYDSDFDLRLIWGGAKRLYQIKNYCHHPSSRPAIFALDFVTMSGTREITIFPVFHRSVDASQVLQQISIHPKIHDFYYEGGYDVSLSLFGISENNIDLFCEVLEAMEICSRRHLYPKLTRASFKVLKIIVHETTIQKPWLSPQFTKSLAQFKSVGRLQLDFLNIQDVELHSLSADLRECLLKGLEHGEWARLQSIELQGSRSRVYLHREDNWVPEDEHW
ncbi:hypothetical protein F5887DRAFT_976978 [Amanita rubescens]|nr:hypothetical protein F5887DRAFT_976978 [Amanita rubescens]